MDSAESRNPEVLWLAWLELMLPVGPFAVIRLWRTPPPPPWGLALDMQVRSPVSHQPHEVDLGFPLAALRVSVFSVLMRDQFNRIKPCLAEFLGLVFLFAAGWRLKRFF